MRTKKEKEEAKLRKKAAKRYKFSDKRHPAKGIVATLIGVLSVGGFIATSIISSNSHGNGGLIIGAIGIVLFIISILGFILAIKSMKEKEIFYRWPVIGATLNAIMIICYFVLYIIGIII